jgi:hypothetical protein
MIFVRNQGNLNWRASRNCRVFLETNLELEMRPILATKPFSVVVPEATLTDPPSVKALYKPVDEQNCKVRFPSQ